MPIYEFRCRACGAGAELLLALGDTADRDCPCGGVQRQRFGRVGVRYGSWGFTSTDRLVTDNRGKDFKALRERAERIRDE